MIGAADVYVLTGGGGVALEVCRTLFSLVPKLVARGVMVYAAEDGSQAMHRGARVERRVEQGEEEAHLLCFEEEQMSVGR